MGTILCCRKSVFYEGLDGIVRLPRHLPEDGTSDAVESHPLECILGILVVGETKHLFFCISSELVGMFAGVPTYRVLKVRYISLDGHTCDDEAESVRSLIESLRFYYTFEDIEEHFLWNGEMLRHFGDAFVSLESCSDASLHRSEVPKGGWGRSPFSTKIQEGARGDLMRSSLAGKMFCGYFEAQTVREGGCLYSIKIRSRISIKKIGTRMLSRGVDDLGKVSFFVETMFVIEGGGEKSEFTILRGSVPVYWSQDDPLKPHKMNLERDYESNQKAFNSHFDKLQQGYGKVVAVDLLGSKKYEKMLSKLYRTLCTENGIDYMHFDLNNHTENFGMLKSLFYDKLARTLSRVQRRKTLDVDGVSVTSAGVGSFMNQQFSPPPNFESLVDPITPSDHAESDARTSSSSSKEEGWEDQDSNSTQEARDMSASADFPIGTLPGNVVFRVNCVDCLDRTNIGQFLIFSFSQKQNFRVAKRMWANNGDALSNMYTGSDALKSELPSKGSISVFGRLNDLVISANRMLNNRFTDRDKQQAIDLLLGRKSS